MKRETRQAWIFCDIDGTGKRWRLAVERENQSPGSDEMWETYFPHADFAEPFGFDAWKEEHSQVGFREFDTPED